MKIELTVSFQNGGKYNPEHNKRTKEQIDRETNTSVNLSEKHINLIDRDPEEVYKELFAEALEEQNAKNKKAGNLNRIMSMEEYIENIKMTELEFREKKKAINEDKSLKGKEKKKALKKLGHRPRFVYEAVVQVGNSKTIPEKYSNKREEWDKMIIELYKKYVENWEKRNPNLVLVGAYIHADEAGATHMHIDYIPVSRNRKRGMKTAPYINDALIAQGIEKGDFSYTPQMRWQDAQRDYVQELCEEFNISASWEARRREGIFELKEHHTDPLNYKLREMREMDKERVQKAKAIFAMRRHIGDYIREDIRLKKQTEQRKRDLHRLDFQFKKQSKIYEEKLEEVKKEYEQKAKEFKDAYWAENYSMSETIADLEDIIADLETKYKKTIAKCNAAEERYQIAFDNYQEAEYDCKQSAKQLEAQSEQIALIHNYLQKHGGVMLPIAEEQARKDFEILQDNLRAAGYSFPYEDR